MARLDAIVLGAGIVGTSVALQLAKRGLAVALVDRRAVGEETSYGNAGVSEGNTIFPPAFPSDPIALLRVALKRAPEANYHLSFLPQLAPWLIAFRAASRPERLIETARLMRPLFAQGRLAQALPQRACVRGAPARTCARAGVRHSPPRARRGRGARARAEPCAGLSSCRVLATRREHHQSAGCDAGLRRALYCPRRGGDARELALAPPRRWALGSRYGRGTARGRAGGGGARTFCPRSPGAARDRAAARHQARISPALPRRRQRRPGAACRRYRERLLPRADGAGHPPHDGRRVCRA